MEVNTAAGSLGFALTTPRRRSAVATDSVRPIGQLPMQLVPAVAVGLLAGFYCDVIDACPCSWDRDWGDGER